MNEDEVSRMLVNPTLYERFAHTKEMILKCLQLEPVHQVLLYFLARGCLMPNLDDPMYFYLINSLEARQEYYDLLIIG